MFFFYTFADDNQISLVSFPFPLNSAVRSWLQRCKHFCTMLFVLFIKLSVLCLVFLFLKYLVAPRIHNGINTMPSLLWQIYWQLLLEKLQYVHFAQQEVLHECTKIHVPFVFLIAPINVNQDSVENTSTGVITFKGRR